MQLPTPTTNRRRPTPARNRRRNRLDRWLLALQEPAPCSQALILATLALGAAALLALL